MNKRAACKQPDAANNPLQTSPTTPTIASLAIPSTPTLAQTFKASLVGMIAASGSSAILAPILFRFVGIWYNVGFYWDALHISLSQLNLSVWESALHGAVSSWLAAVVGLIVVSFWLLVALGWVVSFANVVERTWRWRIVYGVGLVLFDLAFVIALQWMLRVPLKLTPGSWVTFCGILIISILSPVIKAIGTKVSQPGALRYWMVAIRIIGPTGLLVGLFPFVAWFVGPMAQRLATLDGCVYLAANRERFQFSTKTPLLPGVLVPHARKDNKDVLEYDGLYLLLQNEGKYFLYKDLDPQRHTPKEVYVVKESDILGYSTSPDPLKADCQSVR